MNMAKASEADLKMALELASALEAISHWSGGTMPENIAKPQQDEDDWEPFTLDDPEHCRRVCEYLIRLARSASLFRVVMGMVVLLDPENRFIDPGADILAYHPDTVAALKAIAEPMQGS
ncbi:hypothetical protein [Methylomonas sp. UP202]|uniref:hypothetical protein n=1 Tax=Methylomonas sp. UP202 TaxID=3040943 RepID=UPI002478AFD6|nr:hypothetical protein [Methylomonas sp. UP202]WGS88682.1 hypothetical protein QC632_24700 [Methylomonas sp. UP202]